MSPRWLLSGSTVGWAKLAGCGTTQVRDVGLQPPAAARPRGPAPLLRQHGCCSALVLRLPEISSCSNAVWTWSSFSSCSAPIMQFICSCSPSPTSFMDSCGGRSRQQVSVWGAERARRLGPEGRRAGLAARLTCGRPPYRI